MTLTQMIARLTRGYIKETGRSPVGLDKLKIKMEAAEKLRQMNKVIQFPQQRSFKQEIDAMVKSGDINVGTAPKTPPYQKSQADIDFEIMERIKSDNEKAIRGFESRNPKKPTEDKADGGVAGLLGERKAFQGGGSDASTTSFSKSYDKQHGTNTASRANKTVDRRQEEGQRDADRTNRRIEANRQARLIELQYPKESVLDKVKNNPYINNPITRTLGRTALYTLNPTIGMLDARRAMQLKNLYDLAVTGSLPNTDTEETSDGMASGGIARQNFAMGRRAFLKMLAGTGAGIAGLKSGIIGTGGKSATKKAVTETVKSAGSTPPPYFFKLVDKIKTMGDDVTAKTSTQERQQVTRYKDYELTEDVGTGEQTIQRIKIDDGNPQYYDETLAEETYMNYKPGKSQADEATPKVADEYVEDTSYIRTSGPQKGEIYDTVDGIPDDVLEEIGEKKIISEKADGGRIGFDSGGSPLQRLRQSLVDDLMYKFPSMKEEDMQMIVKDINLGMSVEEAQASMSANFIKVFGKSGMFSTGGIAKMLGE